MLKRTGPLRFFSRLPPRFILRRQGPRYTAIFAFWGNFGLDGSCRQILIPRSLRNSALLAPPGSTLALGTCPKESRGAPRRTYIVGLYTYTYKCIGASGVHALKLLEEVFGVSWECLGAPAVVVVVVVVVIVVLVVVVRRCRRPIANSWGRCKFRLGA